MEKVGKKMDHWWKCDVPLKREWEWKSYFWHLDVMQSLNSYNSRSMVWRSWLEGFSVLCLLTCFTALIRCMFSCVSNGFNTIKKLPIKVLSRWWHTVQYGRITACSSVFDLNSSSMELNIICVNFIICKSLICSIEAFLFDLYR